MEEISYIQKSDKKVNNQYTFIGHDAVTAALHPLMVKNGITCLTSVTSHNQDGNRTEATIELILTNVDDPQDQVTIKGFGHGIDSQDKGAGKAVSYAVKMLLLKSFMLETGDRDNEADLVDHTPQEITEMIEKIKVAGDQGDWATLCLLSRTEEWIVAWGKLDSHKKGMINKVTPKAAEYRDLLSEHQINNEVDGAFQLWEELTENEKKALWPMLTNDVQEFIKSIKKEAA